MEPGNFLGRLPGSLILKDARPGRDRMDEISTLSNPNRGNIESLSGKRGLGFVSEPTACRNGIEYSNSRRPSECRNVMRGTDSMEIEQRCPAGDQYQVRRSGSREGSLFGMRSSINQHQISFMLAGGSERFIQGVRLDGGHDRAFGPAARGPS